MFTKKRIVTFIAYLSVFLCIAIDFVIVMTSIPNSSKSSTYEIKNNIGYKTFKPVLVDVSISKNWNDVDLHPEVPAGAQYDGTITNNTNEPIYLWELTMEVPKDAVIDSSWNGFYEIKDGKMTIKPVDYNEEIKAGEKITFGFVMYSKYLVDFQNSVLLGRSTFHYYQSPVYWILCVLAGIWAISVLIHITTYLRTVKYLKRQKRDAQIIIQSMNTFVNMIDAKDTYTQGHSARVAIYSREIARRMKFSEDEINTLYYIALMHDCGKIGIPDAVLKKPEKLTDSEWSLVKSHTQLGSKVLENFTAIDGIRDGALYHHERYDGTGYPEGLKGEDIPLYARIICVADSYDAMNSNRCYRGHLEQDSILEELNANAGTQFDPTIVKHMIAMINDGFVTAL